jgi:cysteine-rich repeat protein
MKPECSTRRAALAAWLIFGSCGIVGGCDLVAGIGTYCVKGTEGCEGGGGAGGGTTTTSSPQGGGGTGGAQTGGGGTTSSSAPECGNGKEEAGEECDDGNKTDADGCEADCTLPKCANGIVDPGELCFTTGENSFPTQGEDARDLALADCDADGDLDVIASNFPEAALIAMRNGGDGAFEEVVKSSSNAEKLGLAVVETGPASFEIVAVYAVSGRVLRYTPDPAVPCKFTQSIGPAISAGALDVVAFSANEVSVPDTAIVLAGENGMYGSLYLNYDHDAILPPSTSAGDPTPSAVAAGDLVGDGAEDLIVTATSQDKLALFENVAGEFTFDSVYIPTGGVGDQPVDVQTGDLDKDGKVDIVTANLGSGTIAVLRNLGAGTFAAQIPEPKVAGDNGVAAAKPRSVALGDMNNDGFLDAVTANSDDSTGKSSVSVFLNDGSGKLVLATKAVFPLVGTDAPFEVGRQPQSVKLGDLNGDGMLDIVTANAFVEGGTSTVSVLLSQP